MPGHVVEVDPSISRFAEQYLADPASRHDAWAGLAALRVASPVYRLENGTWLVASYEGALAVLRSNSFSRGQASRMELDPAIAIDAELAQAINAQGTMMLNLDDPDHGRLRRLVQGAFTPRAVQGWKERIDEIVRELLDGLDDAREFDLQSAFAYPVPERVICALVGVPYEDHRLFEAWTEQMVAVHGVSVVDEAQRERSYQAFKDFYRYFKELVADRRDSGGSDVVSALIRAEEEGAALTTHEIVSTLMLLIAAGHETTGTTIALGAMLLLQHPDQLAKLRRDPSLVRSAVEEVLRFEPQSRMALPRIAVDDVEILGRTIPVGERVIVLINAANRDPARFPSPDTFDVARENNAHLTFGSGIHHCLGSMLARLEVAAAIDRLVPRLSRLEIAAPPVWRQSSVRSLHSLAVRRTD